MLHYKLFTFVLAAMWLSLMCWSTDDVHDHWRPAPDSPLRLWRYINFLLTYLLTYSHSQTIRSAEFSGFDRPILDTFCAHDRWISDSTVKWTNSIIDALIFSLKTETVAPPKWQSLFLLTYANSKTYTQIFCQNSISDRLTDDVLIIFSSLQ